MIYMVNKIEYIDKVPARYILLPALLFFLDLHQFVFLLLLLVFIAYVTFL